MAAAEAEFGRVDVVLNVAGIADGCMLADLDHGACMTGSWTSTCGG